jgi:hypothetical protein
MDVTQCQELGKSLGLEARTLDVLKNRGVKGRDLLAMDSGFLARIGVFPGDREVLQEAVALLRFGGPRMVRLIISPGAPAVEQTFEHPRELWEFLSRTGAAGLCSSARVLTSRFTDLKPGELYWLELSSGSSLKADVTMVKESTSTTDAKVLIDESIKRAVESASRVVFGKALSADPRNDILLKGQGVLLGDVDCLFTGPTLHLLLERKRCLGKDTRAVITQVANTRKAYMDLSMHEVGGAECRVVSMVCAEALSAQAQQDLLQAGIYVLHPADMRIHSPPVV